MDRAVDQANRTSGYFERMTEIRRLLFELKNYTDQSATHTRDAVTANERNRRVLRTVLVSTLPYHPLALPANIHRLYHPEMSSHQGQTAVYTTISASTSKLWSWPRPWPRTSGSGLKILALSSISGTTVCLL